MWVSAPAKPTSIPAAALLERLEPHLPPDLLGAVRGELQYAALKIAALEERLRLQRIEKYGPGGERLGAAQLELLEWEPGVAAEEVLLEGGRGPLPDAPAERPGQRRRGGRQELPQGLAREVVVKACAEAVCGGCGGATVVIGHDEGERLQVRPAEYYVEVTRREKRACPRCPERGVATAPLAPAIIEKGLASDRVVVDAVVAKYCDHVPLYRQSAMLARDAGVEISRATLDGWVMRVGELLQPLALAMGRGLRGADYLQADETPVWVQMHDRRGSNRQAWLWQYSRPEGEAVFDFRLGRGRDGPREFLGGYSGILQTDGYAAYDGVGGAGLVHAACWAHARRKFVEALKANPADAAAALAVARMDALFALDRQARDRGLDHAARHQLRRREAPALLAAIRAQMEQVRGAALPASLLAKAAHYTLALWPRLTCFLDHPALELSNNLAENSMRPVALGRKNWIHIGSPKAAPRVAAILSVVESCRRLGISPRAYLAEVLPGLAARPLAALAQLTPANWQAARS